LTSGGDLSTAERPGQGDRLGSGEGEIEAGDRAFAGNGAKPKRPARGRVHPGQHRDELVGLDLARETKLAGGVAQPLACLLALAGVVVLGAFGHLLQVVALLAFSELADAEHQKLCPNGGANPSPVLLRDGTALVVHPGRAGAPPIGLLLLLMTYRSRKGVFLIHFFWKSGVAARCPGEFEGRDRPLIHPAVRRLDNA
jgi:hypothetical protein